MSISNLIQQKATSDLASYKAVLYSLQFDFDFFVCSYPRSGNTWIRRVLASYVNFQRGFSHDFFHQNKIIPDIHRDDLSRICFEEWLPFRLVKSHDPYTSFVSNKSSVYVFRFPGDALVSFYHFHKRYPELRVLVDDVSVDDFCSCMLPFWCKHVSLALKAATFCKILFVSYEGLCKKTFPFFASIINFLGANLDSESLKKAIDVCSFEKEKDRELKQLNPIHDGERFFRHGRPGGSYKELKQSTVKHISVIADSIYKLGLVQEKRSTAFSLKKIKK